MGMIESVVLVVSSMIGKVDASSRTGGVTVPNEILRQPVGRLFNVREAMNHVSEAPDCAPWMRTDKA